MPSFYNHGGKETDCRRHGKFHSLHHNMQCPYGAACSLQVIAQPFTGRRNNNSIKQLTEQLLPAFRQGIALLNTYLNNNHGKNV